MENAIIVLVTLFIMMFIVDLITGNMIGRHDGVRGNSNCMIFLQPFLSVSLFFSRRKTYNLWSFLSQCTVVLYLIFSMITQIINANIIKIHYRTILISVVVIQSVLYMCLFIDILIYDHKHRNRF